MRERIATPTATRITVPITQVNKPPNDFGIVLSPKRKWNPPKNRAIPFSDDSWKNASNFSCVSDYTEIL